MSAHILWRNKKLWPLCLILSAFSKKLTTERRYSYFIKNNTTVHTERISSEWYSASSRRVADSSLLDPQIWINNINICGGHKEISCMNLKTILRDRMLMCQDKKPIMSQEIFSKCETCFGSNVCILRYMYADETVFELQGKTGLQLSSGCQDPIK